MNPPTVPHEVKQANLERIARKRKANTTIARVSDSGEEVGQPADEVAVGRPAPGPGELVARAPGVGCLTATESVSTTTHGEGRGDSGAALAEPVVPRAGAEHVVEIGAETELELRQEQSRDTRQLLANDQEEEEAAIFGDEDDPTIPPLPQDQPVEALPPMLDEPREALNESKPRRHPSNPTKGEIDKHNLTHSNYRSWCAICNRAALKEDPHYRQTAEEIKKGLPCISYDYKTMGEAEDHDDKITTIISRDRWTGVTKAHVVKGKGLADDWIIEQIVEDIASLGYTDIRIRSDNENAIVLLLERVKALRDLRNVGKTLIEPAVPGQPQTNGVAEKAVQDLTTQVRKYKIAIETRLGQPVPARSIVFRWLVPHSADTINRSCPSLAHDGKVPFQRLNNKMPKPIDVEFGEQV